MHFFSSDLNFDLLKAYENIKMQKLIDFIINKSYCQLCI